MSTQNKNRQRIFELVLFAMLGAIMFASKIIMELLPNIHLIGMFIVSFTVVFRWKALYPIYIFVIITGLYNGFATWWIPYLYIWSILWAITMLIPKNIPKSSMIFQKSCFYKIISLHRNRRLSFEIQPFPFRKA